MTNDEILAGQIAISKVVEPAVKAAKQEQGDRIWKDLRNGGSDRRPVMLDGEKVGEFAMSYSSPGPEIVDTTAAIEFLESVGLTRSEPVRGWQSNFAQVGDEVVYTPTGEVCDFLVWRGRTPKYVKTNGFDPDVVLPKLLPKLGGSITPLLGGE